MRLRLPWHRDVTFALFMVSGCVRFAVSGYVAGRPPSFVVDAALVELDVHESAPVFAYE
jgi:hypothetical protein